MPQGTISYTGVANPKGGVYTQTLGVYPDAVALRAIPQGTNIPASGTVTFSYNGSSITLPNCVTDAVRIMYSPKQGHLLSIIILDRRERWKYAAPISGEYNVSRAGTQIASKKLSLRALVQLLLQAMGEATPVVSVLSNAIFPEVRWKSVPPREALDQLLKEWGFSLNLGFGSENVTVVQIGTGATLNTTDAMQITSALDPKFRPRYVRTCFNDSLMQARLKLEAVGLDTDNTWKPIDSLSYKPAAGWEIESPYTLPTTQVNETADEYARAIRTVFRAYRIKRFADDTLNIPGSGGLTISNIQQLLPLQNRLLDSETIRDDKSYIPFRIYGKRMIPSSSSGQPAVTTTTAVDAEIIGEKVTFDGENGIIIFEQPQFWVDAGAYKPADLYLECTFNIFSSTTFAPNRYEKDVEIDGTSSGYYAVRYHETEARSVVNYGANHAFSSLTTNQTDLDSIATLIASQVGSQFSTLASQMVVYAQPQLGIRCDGAIHQVSHVIDDGTNAPASYTIASRNQEFDRNIYSRDERTASIQIQAGILTGRSQVALERRKERTDD